MLKSQLYVLLVMVSFVFTGSFAMQASAGQAAPERTVRSMTITGEIAQASHGYIIRGKAPAEIFTILNPDPKVLDKFVKSGKTLRIEARIVSGDNVEIVKLDGAAYSSPDAGTRGPAVRNMTITGEIAQASHGYIIRGKVPAAIFTILNPDPKVLDKFVKNGKTVSIEVRIVSGDNVEIVKLAGRKYLKKSL